jgi:hypothetical protein
MTARWCAVLVVLLTGCTHAAGDDIVTEPPTGYTLVTGSSGPMDLVTAAESTGADSAAKRRVLDKLGYQGGTVRIWRDPAGDFAAVFVFRFPHRSGPDGLRAFEVEQLQRRAGGNVYSPDLTGGGLFEVAGIPGATGFVVTGFDRARGAPIFIDGVLFAAGSRAYLVETGGAQPTGTERVLALARRQYERLRSG